MAALAVDLVAARRCAEVRLDDAQRRALVGLAEDAAALGGVAQGGVGGAMIAGAPTVQRPLHILSLGAGVQSSTLALMAAHGEITPMPSGAIFADTGAEPRKVYEWLDWLEKQLPYPVYRVMHKDGLRENILGAIKGGRFAGAPFFTSAAVSGQREGQLKRQCTSEFKIEPIQQKVRALMGLGKGEQAPKGIAVVQWIGISTDEAARMKPSRLAYVEHRWPLIEGNMSRNDCLKWMESHGYPKPGKSACTFCPYHDDHLWREMKKDDPESWADAVQIDEAIRGGVRGTTQKLYLHRSMKPLAEVDLRNAEDAGQISLFDQECEGMCGV